MAADLDRAPADAHLLAEDECERASRYRFERDRRRFVAGRATLRRLLADYLDCTPTEVELAYGPHGKPFVRPEGLSFNVSHSAGCALFAFAPGFEVGIDVELPAARGDDERVAAQFFSPGEVATLRAQPPASRPLAFLRCWTRKEAYIKARGEGLQLPLHDFDVAFDPAAPVALLRTAWSSDEPTQWTLRDVSSLAGGGVAALAVRAPEVRVVNSGRVD
ncbi:MAG TPA: 4'-phosphopantetheinyl transferase superfamily protein [Gaiellaceae bacterium]